MADVLSEWMEKSFGMTASMPVDTSVDVIHCQQDLISSENKEREKIATASIQFYFDRHRQSEKKRHKPSKSTY